MAEKPIIFAMANPIPEIMPEDVKSIRSDAIIATGRSDYPNQVNNVLGFPYIFRGALDVRATTINEEMKIAAANAIAELARKDVVRCLRNGENQLLDFDKMTPDLTNEWKDDAVFNAAHVFDRANFLQKDNYMKMVRDDERG